MPIKPGTIKRFVYPNFGTPDSYPNYTAHSKQRVEVLRSMAADEAAIDIEPMYEVRAADGWVGHAWASELRRVRPSSNNT